MEFLEKLQKQCFEDKYNIPMDMQGWMSQEFFDYFQSVVHNYKDPTIIEV